MKCTSICLHFHGRAVHIPLPIAQIFNIIGPPIAAFFVFSRIYQNCANPMDRIPWGSRILQPTPFESMPGQRAARGRCVRTGGMKFGARAPPRTNEARAPAKICSQGESVRAPWSVCARLEGARVTKCVQIGKGVRIAKGVRAVRA
jgi:hypothetical protein